MARTIYLDKLLRLTLTRKGKAIAKHPLLREGAVEAVKAESLDEPLWTAVKAGEDDEPDWYEDFATFIASTPDEDIPESWEEAFAISQDTAVKAGAKKKNYPDGEGPFAGPHNSFPISSQAKVFAAARLIGHAANPAAVKQRIISIARSRGWKLPKSWQKAKKGFMDPEQFDELVSRLSEALKGSIVVTPASEAPAAQEESAAADETEKASMSHSHEHNHSTQRGYGYSHTHDHTHKGDMSDHETSESAHGHDHVSKADELDPAVKADLDGMDAEIVKLKAQVAQLETEKAALAASVQAKDAEVAAKAQEAEEAKTAHEAIKAELAKAEAAAKEPLTAASPTTEKAAQKPLSEMSFDEALAARLHS